MKKVKLISMLSIGFVGGGLLTLVPFVITSCSKTPTKLVVNGVENNQISIHTTLNCNGSYTFFCHDNLGGLPTNVNWMIVTSNDSINIDSSTGVLTWGNNLDPDDKSSNEFTLSCSSGELRSDTYYVSIIVDQTPGNDICPNSWLQVSASGALTLKAGVNKNQIHKLVIPSQLNGTNITSIGGNAFRDCSSLTSITLPSFLTFIDTNAFMNCSSLTSLTLPNSVISIALQAFMNCSSLASIDLPNSLDSIGESAFMNCSSLTQLTLPNSLTGIESSAFYNCSSLTSIALTRVIDWTESIFQLVDGTNGSSNGDLITDGLPHHNAFLIASNDISGITGTNATISNAYRLAVGYITIPSTINTHPITSINSSAFIGCLSLTSLTLPNSVTSIGIYAFAYCSSLTSVTLSNSLTSIGDSAFNSCSSLTSITAAYDSPPTFTVGSNAFLNVAFSGTVENTGILDSQVLFDYLKNSLPDGWHLPTP